MKAWYLLGAALFLTACGGSSSSSGGGGGVAVHLHRFTVSAAP